MSAGPRRFMVEVTTPDGAPVAVVDLDYSLAIDGTSPDGVYVYPQPAGARILVDEDSGNSAAYFLTAAECVRLAHYLLACAKAAES